MRPLSVPKPRRENRGVMALLLVHVLLSLADRCNREVLTISVDLNAIQHIHAFLDGVDFITIEIRGALLELGEILDRAQASFRPVNLLIDRRADSSCRPD